MQTRRLPYAGHFSAMGGKMNFLFNIETSGWIEGS